MKVVEKQGDEIAVSLSGEEREILLAVVEAAKVTDPVITDTPPNEIDHFKDIVFEATKTETGYVLHLNEYRLLKLRRLVDAVTSMGEREEYSEYVNRLQRDDTIDRFDDAIHRVFNEAFPK